jgi:BirA family transcriptional regulator, biotin operon repressor / biotin---[acetyl-CoA-carboxylase] ligase
MSRADRPTPLDAAAIQAHLRERGAAPTALEVLPVVDSTNRYLLETLDPVSGAACLAETQSGGRGRQGRRWISTPNSNLLFSVAWYFAAPRSALAGLSLAAGLAVVRALDDCGVVGAALKWPNDVCWNGRKLCGVLTESRPDAGRGTRAVIGVGINICMGAAEAKQIDQPWVDVREILGKVPDRNRLGAYAIAEIRRICESYAVSGFEPFRAEWNARHAFHGSTVEWHDGARAGQGRVVGTDADGALRIRDNAGEERVFHSGEISLRVGQE